MTYCYPICAVDVAGWDAFLSGCSWPEPSTPTKPQRIHGDALPGHLLEPIAVKVLPHLGISVVLAHPMLSRMLLGQVHPMHVDNQESDWIARVHVPLITNPQAWVQFEGEERQHLERGTAYYFNTLARHAFGNEGETERVHLLFEVMRKDT